LSQQEKLGSLQPPRSTEEPAPEYVRIQDELDEAQIEAETLGKALGDFVYSFSDNSGKTVTDLAYAGIRKVFLDYVKGPVRIIPCEHCHQDCHVDETESELRGRIRMRDERRGKDVVGAASATKEFLSKDGKTKYPNKFAWAIVHGKSLRNAMRLLIDDEVAKQAIIAFQEKGKLAKSVTNSKS